MSMMLNNPVQLIEEGENNSLNPGEKVQTAIVMTGGFKLTNLLGAIPMLIIYSHQAKKAATWDISTSPNRYPSGLALLGITQERLLAYTVGIKGMLGMPRAACSLGEVSKVEVKRRLSLYSLKITFTNGKTLQGFVAMSLGDYLQKFADIINNRAITSS
jgi:hypothetical protein